MKLFLVMQALLSVFAFAALPLALAQQSAWGQCGGIDWKGATTCSSGNTCIRLNDYYSQCQPGSASTTATTLRTTTAATTSSRTSSSASESTTTITIRTSSPTQTTSSPTRTTSGATVSGSGPGSTLQSGYYWIRAVAEPNYRKYLQTSPLNASPGRAILSDNTSAGQFNIVDGQLVELIDNKGTLLYANVGERPSPSATILPVTFTTTKNSFGTFAYQGDTVTWSAAGVQRQNVAAWYVCEGQTVWINLGAYLYGTPAGCADQTIHSYGNSRADV
ncbi:hypothetical protein Q7P37_006895 [Cladosporium fusiforme]